MVTAFHVIVDIVIPAVMVAMFACGLYIVRRAPERLAAAAGLAAGLIAFTIYALSSFKEFRAAPFSASNLPSFQWLPTLAGVVVGFTILWLLQRLQLSTGLVGLLVLLFVASSTIAGFSYFFASPLRRYAIYFALSLIFGVLIYVALFSNKLRENPELNSVLGRRRR